MDKERMIFEIDRRTVTEGDVVEINWQCDSAEQVILTIDNGYRSTAVPLEPTGTKRFRLNRSKGKTHLTISVTIAGKVYRKNIDVRVKKMPTMHAETVDSRGRRQGKLKQWWEKQRSKRRNSRSKFKQSLQMLPERKQMAVKLLIILGVVLLLSAIWPGVYRLALPLLVLYLGFVVIKR